MNNIKDLNLQSEILPLFDFTHNDFAKDALLDLLQEPLSDIDDIETRQCIIKAFLANLETFKDYSYSRVDYYEIYRFLSDTSIETYVKGIKLKLLFSEKERNQTRARFIQFVILFRHLHVSYIKRINTSIFPREYKDELIELNDFLTAFNFEFYDELIRDDKFKTKHINELTKIVLEKQITGAVSAFYKSLFIFEAYLSISKGVYKNKFCFPTFCDNYIAFEHLFHPLIKDPVKNSFTSRNNVILLTGPNMSGKSTFLKSIGLCVYLAHVGIGVPASKAQLPFFDHLSISINHNDDILSGYSHFMTEIKRLKDVVVEATTNKKCFAVFDELFKGTNIDDAVQISSTTIKGLMNFKNSFFFISTHLHQLKELEQVKTNQVETYYVDCDIKDGTPLFSYQIKAGWSDLKVGQMLFEKEGLNELLQPKSANGYAYKHQL
jgi:DNA mismatch repair protein MutS